MTQSGGSERIKLELRRHIEDLERQLREAKAFLASLDGSADPRDVPIMEMMRGLELHDVRPPFVAIRLFLTHVGKPQPRRVICRALMLGGAALGDQREKSVNQAISTNVKLKKLEEPDYDTHKKKQNPDNLVGLPGMFGKKPLALSH
jgi:hypothetical protein